MTVANRHVLVTGAARRIGRALSEALLDRNARLSAHYFRSQDEITTLEVTARKRKKPIFVCRADLRNTTQIRAAVKDSVRHFGAIDILINSASLFYPTLALDCTDSKWQRLLDTNLKGQFFFAQACARSMRKNGGVIINIADVNGEKPRKYFTPYTASKAGLLMMTRNLALEWAPKIRVNSISPGPILPPEQTTEEEKHRSSETTLLKRWGNPQDIVDATSFLIENDYITGFNLCIDGGRSIG